MPKGFKTGGRQKGTKNKRTLTLERLGINPDANGLLPLEFMLTLMRDGNKPDELRAEMAKAAAPYLHARRAPEDKEGKTLAPVLYVHPDLEGE